MGIFVTTAGTGPAGLGRLRRPAGIAQRTRWLFAGLSMISLLITLPNPLSVARGSVLLLLAGAALVLIASCLYVYLTGRVPLALDLLNGLAIAGFALTCTTPEPALGYVFASIWFNSLYGSLWRSLGRCALYGVAFAACIRLWTLIPGHAVAPSMSVAFQSLPVMVLTVLVARQLGSGLQAREQCLRRDGALAITGSRLLGVTDIAEVWATAWTAAVEICAATPGLRLLRAVRTDAALRVEGATGGFATVPATLPRGLVTVPDGSAEGYMTDHDPLNDAVGVPIEWVCLGLTEQVGEVWLLAGAPKKISAEAMVAVRSLINQIRLAGRNCAVHDELIAQAHIDSLTGLVNRAAFTARLTAQVAHRERAEAVQVLFVDLDDFKDVNDLLGHIAGDELLIEVAARMRACIRPRDVCARLGGDEFAVMLVETPPAEAAGVAQRIMDAIATPIHVGGRTVRVGASIGIATGSGGIDIDELVHRADVAMYAAKAQGKGRVQVFDQSLLRADSSRLVFERELAGAAEAGELVVYYQPILSLPDLRCTAVEALVRWQHPERGLLHPQQFIEEAERGGSILDIGDFVLRQACRDVVRWQDQFPGSSLPVHINVSARQLDDDHFIETVISCLKEYEIPACCLVLELTETVVLNSPVSIGRLRTLAEYGVSIAIDDFGTGYSSLTTLRSLPVNIIKLDRIFVAGALMNPTDRIVLEAIVQMSNRLGLLTIAEGVERAEQQKLLHEIGTDAVQGYLYLTPVPAVQLTTWLQANFASTRAPSSNIVALRTHSP